MQNPKVFYSGQKEEDLYFTAIPVTKTNKEFWCNYHNDLKPFDRIEELLIQTPEKLGDDEIKPQNFLKLLNFIGQMYQGIAGFTVLPPIDDKGQEIDAEQWVVLASSKPIEHPYDVNFFNHKIEMSVMVTTSLTAPFSVPMGISRTSHSLFFEEYHPGIAVDMLAFAAKFVQMHYNNMPESVEKTYMMHSPIPFMRELMLQKFPGKYKEATAEEDNFGADESFTHAYPNFYGISLRHSCKLDDLTDSIKFDVKPVSFDESKVGSDGLLDPYEGFETLNFSKRIIGKLGADKLKEVIEKPQESEASLINYSEPLNSNNLVEQHNAGSSSYE